MLYVYECAQEAAHAPLRAWFQAAAARAQSAPTPPYVAVGSPSAARWLQGVCSASGVPVQAFRWYSPHGLEAALAQASDFPFQPLPSEALLPLVHSAAQRLPLGPYTHLSGQRPEAFQAPLTALWEGGWGALEEWPSGAVQALPWADLYSEIYRLASQLPGRLPPGLYRWALAAYVRKHQVRLGAEGLFWGMEDVGHHPLLQAAVQATDSPMLPFAAPLLSPAQWGTWEALLGEARWAGEGTSGALQEGPQGPLDSFYGSEGAHHSSQHVQPFLEGLEAFLSHTEAGSSPVARDAVHAQALQLGPVPQVRSLPPLWGPTAQALQVASWVEGVLQESPQARVGVVVGPDSPLDAALQALGRARGWGASSTHPPLAPFAEACAALQAYLQWQQEGTVLAFERFLPWAKASGALPYAVCEGAFQAFREACRQTAAPAFALAQAFAARSTSLHRFLSTFPFLPEDVSAEVFQKNLLQVAAALGVPSEVLEALPAFLGGVPGGLTTSWGGLGEAWAAGQGNAGPSGGVGAGANGWPAASRAVWAQAYGQWLASGVFLAAANAGQFGSSSSVPPAQVERVAPGEWLPQSFTHLFWLMHLPAAQVLSGGPSGAGGWGALLPEACRQALNQGVVQQGPQGLGHWVWVPGKAALRGLGGALSGPGGPLDAIGPLALAGLTAFYSVEAAFDSSHLTPDSEPPLPSPALLSTSAVGAAPAGPSVASPLLVEEFKAPPAPTPQGLTLRGAQWPADPAPRLFLPAQSWEAAREAPERVWRKEILGLGRTEALRLLQPSGFAAPAWGRWVHAWLAQAWGSADAPSAAAAVEAAARSTAQQAQAAYQQAGHRAPPLYWQAGFQHARAQALAWCQAVYQAAAEYGFPYRYAEVPVCALPEWGPLAGLPLYGRLDLLLSTHPLPALLPCAEGPFPGPSAGDLAEGGSRLYADSDGASSRRLGPGPVHGLAQAHVWVLDFKTSPSAPPLSLRPLRESGQGLQPSLYAYALAALGAGKVWLSTVCAQAQPLTPQLTLEDLFPEAAPGPFGWVASAVAQQGLPLSTSPSLSSGQPARYGP